MSATSMEFAGSCFACVLCVEAAMHFDTRKRFLAEALRVLKPGGYLALADGASFVRANYLRCMLVRTAGW